ncbi:MAG: twin-arginine translocase TatA/TatE family subunit [Candidatus Pristimantibacillus lignocellulolyticus]|uniref:Sec-independent protein translocase protein TatA n=1 Tax=Candidatus Pristimantibacillus lignocellulolyticus TaxID=2994561 RepID=A0A9J6ZKR8_9BACL|nr:MAG: twin-arginine translocase TatA/TatE family subunit [Candidatus Pristimantibacillus lignocellulolyticus]
MGIGVTGVILLVLVALLLFGPNKLPELGRAVGRTLREFKTGANEMLDSNDKKNEDTSRVEVNQVEQTEKNNKRLPD